MPVRRLCENVNVSHKQCISDVSLEMALGRRRYVVVHGDISIKPPSIVRSMQFCNVERVDSLLSRPWPASDSL